MQCTNVVGYTLRQDSGLKMNSYAATLSCETGSFMLLGHRSPSAGIRPEASRLQRREQLQSSPVRCGADATAELRHTAEWPQIAAALILLAIDTPSPPPPPPPTGCHRQVAHWYELMCSNTSWVFPSWDGRVCPSLHLRLLGVLESR